MILTIEEAQRILRKVFADTAGDVRIDGSENATASVDNYMPEIVAGVAHVRGKIHAIKMYRSLKDGVGLADAKHYVEEQMTRHNVSNRP